MAGELENTRFVGEPETRLAAICVGCDSRDLVGASATLGVAHFDFARLAISPENGFAATVTFRRREPAARGIRGPTLRSRPISESLNAPRGTAYNE